MDNGLDWFKRGLIQYDQKYANYKRACQHCNCNDGYQGRGFLGGRVADRGTRGSWVVGQDVNSDNCPNKSKEEKMCLLIVKNGRQLPGYKVDQLIKPPSPPPILPPFPSFPLYFKKRRRRPAQTSTVHVTILWLYLFTQQYRQIV